MATIEITVTSEFSFEPDAVYFLEGANVQMKVLELLRDQKQGKYIIDTAFYTHF